ncbi:hypothetical protein [Arthrobacter sp. H14]|uniref:hypothetical protein n=1 Tax=Arthrobacter sp. H14 TaxID=1312959 RepID=UPI0012DD141C|nr:hypothetical protein [Arthrobacter sp. H14]
MSSPFTEAVAPSASSPARAAVMYLSLTCFFPLVFSLKVTGLDRMTVSMNKLFEIFSDVCDAGSPTMRRIPSPKGKFAVDLIGSLSCSDVAVFVHARPEITV